MTTEVEGLRKQEISTLMDVYPFPYPLGTVVLNFLGTMHRLLVPACTRTGSAERAERIWRRDPWKRCR